MGKRKSVTHSKYDSIANEQASELIDIVFKMPEQRSGKLSQTPNSDKVELGQKSNKIPTDAEMDSLCASGEITYIKGKPANFGQPDCECKHCQYNRTYGNRFTLNHGAWKSVSELGKQEFNRVSLPGDVDYVGVAI